MIPYIPDTDKHKKIRELNEQNLEQIRKDISRFVDKYNSYPPGNIPGLDKDKLSDFSDIKAVPDGLFDPNNLNKPGSTSDLPFDNFPGTQLIPPSLDLPDSTIFPKDVPLDLPNVTTFPGASCPANYPDLSPPFFEAKDKTIYFGDGFQEDHDHFHKNIKPEILKKAGKFQGKVGKNPDIKVVNEKIVLTGTGSFKGKSFKTDLNASDFLGK
jgi:hypothetical protein